MVEVVAIARSRECPMAHRSLLLLGRTGVADVDVAQPLEPDYDRLGHVKQSQAIFNETD
jgi:hypothetical protein